MQGERDALLKLIQSLRHEYEAVQAAKLGQESEIQGLKVMPCALSTHTTVCLTAVLTQHCLQTLATTKLSILLNKHPSLL